MRLLLILSTVTLMTNCQTVDNDTKKKVEEFFKPTPTPFMPGFEEVTKSGGSGSIGAQEQCGEGADKGLRMCVPYHMCDGKTNTIVQKGVNKGFGVINIRLGENLCQNYLDVCCKIPQGGLSPNFTPRPDSSTIAPTKAPPVELPVTKPPTPSFCGIRNPQGIDFKITGNKDGEAEYGEFPWMVALIHKIDATTTQPTVCGGSLITPNVVLTAAHCVYSKSAGNLKVRAGEWDTQTTRERLPYQERNVVNIIMHSQFDAGIVTNDAALLILDRPIDRADNVGTICLPTQGEVVVSSECFVSGWGKDFFGNSGRFQSILKKISLPTVTHNECQDALRTTRLGTDFVLDDSFMCAGGKQGKDACTGDGGSPLVCPDPHNANRYVQVGIVAWGIGCGEGNIPGVYADVAKFRSWIDQQMERLNIDTASYNS